jgi:haloalkane dehalogenase
LGLSIAPAGYRYTIAEHARAVEGVVARLGLREITLMVQDWGGPIGFWVATRHPEWFRAFVIGNTRAWPMRGERSTEWFSKALGSPVPGGLLVRRADRFVNVFMRGLRDQWFGWPAATSRSGAQDIGSGERVDLEVW